MPLALLLAAFAGPAAADVLVSNIGQSNDGTNGNLAVWDFAQGFTTGSNAGGYNLESVEVKVAATLAAALRVRITIATPDGTTKATLNNPSSLAAGNVTFTAPSGTELAANTVYYVVLDIASAGRFATTSSDAEDPGGAAGWSIENGRQEGSGNMWQSRTGDALMIRVNGSAVDAHPPVLRSARVDGDVLTLNYDEPLGTGSTPATTAFTVSVGGTDQTPTAVGLGGAAVKLTLGTAATAGQAVTVSYTAGTNPIKSEGGNAANLVGRSVVNTTDETKPSVTLVAVVSTPTKDPSSTGTADTYPINERIRVGVRFDEAVAVTGTPQLKIKMGPTFGEFSADYESGSGTTQLTFGYKVVSPNTSTAGIAVLENTLELDTGTIESAATHAAAVLTHAGLAHDPAHKVNSSLSGALPEFESATVDGTELKVTFNKALDTSSSPTSSRFQVTTPAGTTDGTSAAVSISGRVVTATLTAAVEWDDAVTVSYTKGSETNPLKDTATTPNEVADFSGKPVTNLTPKALELLAGTIRWSSGDSENTVALWFDEPLDTSGTAPAASQFSISPGVGTISGVSRSDTQLSFKTPTQSDATSSYSVSMSDTTGIVGTNSEQLPAVSGFGLHNLNAAQESKPALSSAAVDGDTLTLTYDNTLLAGRPPPTSKFSVAGTGRTTSVDALAIDGAKVVLTLSPPVEEGDSGITVSYDKDSSATPRTQNPWGIQSDALTNQSVTNSTSDTTAPGFRQAWVAGNGLVVSFGEDLDTSSAPAGSRFSVRAVDADGAGRDISGTSTAVVVTGAAADVALESAVRFGETVTVSYTKGTETNPLKDSASTANEVADFSDETVVNSTAVAPSGATVNGTTLTIAFNGDLDTTAAPAATRFTVAGTDTTTTVSSVAFKSGDATMVELTLSAAVGVDESGITVSYAVGSDANPLKGTGGKFVADFSSLAVTNETPSPVTAVKLVGNTGQSPTSNPTFGHDFAQAFTTGDGTGGYNLTRVNIRMNSTATTPPVYSVHIEENASGAPAGSATRLGTLTNPTLSSTIMNHEFDAPAGGIDLDASPVYWLVVDVDSRGSGGTTRLESTASDDEDAGKAANWDLSNDSLTRSLVATSWTSASQRDDSLQIAVYGYAEPAAFSSAVVDGTTLNVRFDAALSSDSAHVPATGAFDVQVAGSAATVSAVSIQGAAVRLTLATAVTIGQTVTVAYTKPASGNKLVDGDGNELASFTARSVSNVTGIDATAPTVSSVTVSSSPAAGSTYIIGETISFTVAFSENVTVTGEPQIPFTLGTATKNATFASGGGSASLVFNYTVAAGDLDTDGIAVGANALELNGGTIQDGAAMPNNATLTHGGIAADAAHKVDGVKPTLAVNPKPTVVGTELTMTFSETLGAAPSLANGAFDVTRTRGGSPQTVTLTGTPSINGNRVTLTQSTPTLDADTDVKVRYTKPGSGTGNRIRDVAGNEADTFGDQAVTNNPLPQPPTFDLGASTTFTIKEDHVLTKSVGTVDAGDANGDTLTYSLASGGDNTSFTIGTDAPGDSGEIKLKSGRTLDFERKSTYSITARVTDGEDANGNPQANPTIDATIAVTINVTDVSEPPLAPEAPRVRSAPDGSDGFDVRVNWRAPDNSGRPRIDDYDLRWVAAASDPGDTDPSWITASETGGVVHDGTGTSATIAGLMADTTYRVQVRAANADGLGDWSDSGVGNTAVFSASASGTRLTITFNVDLNTESVPDPTAFTIKVPGSPDQTPTAVAVSGRSVTLTLASAVAAGETVAVDYTPPSTNPLQDMDGDSLPALVGQQVDAPRPSGGGGGGGAPRNAAPEATKDIGEQMLRTGAALEVDLSKHFSDADEDALDYTAESSDPAVASVAVDGEVLTVRAVDRGSADITVTATDPDEASVTQTFAVTVTGPEAVWYLPPAVDPMRQGFVRVVNHSRAVAGEATVTATDDAGRRYEPLTLALKGREAAHFNSDDLELGNAAKGLTGSTGPGTGGWRLAIESDEVDVEALGYVRTTDGFVTAMGAVAPLVDGAREVATFNPGSNVNQVSFLRLVNPADEDAEVTVTGVDDAGRSPGAAVELTVAAGTSCTVDAAQLESGSGLACGLPQAGLGDGAGKWRLTVASDVPLTAMSLLSSPTGHLTNLSATNEPDADGVWRVHLFPAASDPLGRQGFVRVINRSDQAGEVTITASDDSDVAYETLTLALQGGAAVHFNSDDLELGNAEKGLTGSTGSGMGTWRLALESDDAAGTPVEFEAHAYIRTADGFLTAMNGQAPERDGVHRVALFNPGSNANQVSVLRLINPGANNRWVRIVGTDDSGVRPGTAVRVLVPATDAVELTAAELESGESVEPGLIDSGAIGDGSGKWRLHIEADPEVAVLSLLSSPTGHLTNLSRADGSRGYESGVAAPLPPPDTVTLESPATRQLRGRWSVVEGARYAVDLLQDGVRDDDRSLTRSTRNTFRWQSLSPGTYTIRACSVNEDRRCGPWSAESNAVVIN